MAELSAEKLLIIKNKKMNIHKMDSKVFLAVYGNVFDKGTRGFINKTVEETVKNYHYNEELLDFIPFGELKGFLEKYADKVVDGKKLDVFSQLTKESKQDNVVSNAFKYSKNDIDNVNANLAKNLNKLLVSKQILLNMLNSNDKINDKMSAAFENMLQENIFTESLVCGQISANLQYQSRSKEILDEKITLMSKEAKELAGKKDTIKQDEMLINLCKRNFTPKEGYSFKIQRDNNGAKLVVLNKDGIVTNDDITSIVEQTENSDMFGAAEPAASFALFQTFVNEKGGLDCKGIASNYLTQIKSDKNSMKDKHLKEIRDKEYNILVEDVKGLYKEIEKFSGSKFLQYNEAIIGYNQKLEEIRMSADAQKAQMYQELLNEYDALIGDSEISGFVNNVNDSTALIGEKKYGNDVIHPIASKTYGQIVQCREKIQAEYDSIVNDYANYYLILKSQVNSGIYPIKTEDGKYVMPTNTNEQGIIVYDSFQEVVERCFDVKENDFDISSITEDSLKQAIQEGKIAHKDLDVAKEQFDSFINQMAMSEAESEYAGEYIAEKIEKGEELIIDGNTLLFNMGSLQQDKYDKVSSEIEDTKNLINDNIQYIRTDYETAKTIVEKATKEAKNKNEENKIIIEKTKDGRFVCKIDDKEYAINKDFIIEKEEKKSNYSVTTYQLIDDKNFEQIVERENSFILDDKNELAVSVGDEKFLLNKEYFTKGDDGKYRFDDVKAKDYLKKIKLNNLDNGSWVIKDESGNSKPLLTDKELQALSNDSEAIKAFVSAKLTPLYLKDIRKLHGKENLTPEEKEIFEKIQEKAKGKTLEISARIANRKKELLKNEKLNINQAVAEGANPTNENNELKGNTKPNKVSNVVRQKDDSFYNFALFMSPSQKENAIKVIIEELEKMNAETRQINNTDDLSEEQHDALKSVVEKVVNETENQTPETNKENQTEEVQADAVENIGDDKEKTEEDYYNKNDNLADEQDLEENPYIMECAQETISKDPEVASEESQEKAEEDYYNKYGHLADEQDLSNNPYIMKRIQNARPNLGVDMPEIDPDDLIM